MLELLLGAVDGPPVPLPFGQEIHLLDCHVAGTAYVELADVEPELEPGQVMVFQREPDNPHDPLAIRINDAAGHKLGYVPRAKNEILARLMDAGKLIFGRLEAKAWRDAWLKLDIGIFLNDI